MRLVHVIELHNVDTCNEPLPERLNPTLCFGVVYLLFAVAQSHKVV